jgi:hypothetical protein
MERKIEERMRSWGDQRFFFSEFDILGGLPDG